MQTTKIETSYRVIKLTNELRVYHNDVLKKIDQKEAELKQLLFELAKPHADTTTASVSIFPDLSTQAKGISRIAWNLLPNSGRITKLSWKTPPLIHDAPAEEREEGCCSSPNVTLEEERKENEVKMREDSSFMLGAVDSLLMPLTSERRRFTVIPPSTTYNAHRYQSRGDNTPKRFNFTTKESLRTKESRVIVAGDGNTFHTEEKNEVSIDSIGLSPIERLPFDQDRSLEEEGGNGVKVKFPRNEVSTSAAPAKRVRFTSQSPLVEMFSVDRGASEEENVEQNVCEGEKTYNDVSKTSDSPDFLHSLREGTQNILGHLAEVRKSLYRAKKDSEIYSQDEYSCKEMRKYETCKGPSCRFSPPPSTFAIRSSKGSDVSDRRRGKDSPLTAASLSLIQTADPQCEGSISSKPIHLSSPLPLSATISTTNTNGENEEEAIGAADCVSHAYPSPPPIYLHRSLREKERGGSVLKASYTINPIRYAAVCDSTSSFADREVASLVVELHDLSKGSLLANAENALSSSSFSSSPFLLRRNGKTSYASHCKNEKERVPQNILMLLSESTEAGVSKLGLRKAAGEASNSLSHQVCRASVRHAAYGNGSANPVMLAGGPTLYFT